MSPEYGYLGHIYDIQRVDGNDAEVKVISPRVATEETEALIIGLDAYVDMGERYGRKKKVQAFNYEFRIPTENVDEFKDRVKMIGGIILSTEPNMAIMRQSYEQMQELLPTLSSAREWLEQVARRDIPDDDSLQEVLERLYKYQEELCPISVTNEFDKINYSECSSAEDKAQAHAWLLAIEDYNSQVAVVRNDVDSTLHRIGHRDMYFSGHTSLAYQIAREMDITVSESATIDEMVASVREQWEDARRDYHQIQKMRRSIERLSDKVRDKDEQIAALVDEITVLQADKRHLQERIRELSVQTGSSTRKLNLQ